MNLLVPIGLVNPDSLRSKYLDAQGTKGERSIPGAMRQVSGSGTYGQPLLV